MSDHDTSAADRDDKASTHSDADADALNSLKQLLFSEERAELETLRHDVDASGLTSEELSKLLPKAVWSAASRDEQLSDALSPMLGGAIHSAIKNDAESIAEAISPIMGPAIRNSIQQSIRAMTQSLNKTLEYSVSAKGLKWRWEAFKTGKSFAEVVLLHTLRYRIVQVFLVDRESGLLITHATLAETVENVDLTSGMLTAIQDFARDSLGSEDDNLLNFSFGNQTVWIETGPQAYLAAVIEGEAPLSLRIMVRATLEKIHIRFRDELAAYEGDSAPLSAIEPILDGCLVSAYEEDEKKIAEKRQIPKRQKRPIWQKALIALATAGALFAILTWNRQIAHSKKLASLRRQLAVPATVDFQMDNGELVFRGTARHDWIQETAERATRLPDINQVRLDEVEDLDREWITYLQVLRGTAGLVITEAHANDGQYGLAGLRDPLAEDPVQLLEPFDLTPECVASRWLPFQSLEPDIVAQRIRAALPPNTTEIDARWNGDTLQFVGTASQSWLKAAELRANQFAATTLKLDFSQVIVPKPIPAPEPRPPAPKPIPKPAPQPIPPRSSADDLQIVIKRAALHRQFSLFDPGDDRLSTEQRTLVPAMAKLVMEVFQAAELADHDVQLTLVGTASIRDQDSVALSKRRAEAVWKELQKFDVPAGNVMLQGIGAAALDGLPPGFSAEMATRCCVLRMTVTPNEPSP